jgi:hypothetical protein
LAHAACNVAPEAPSLACRIEPRLIDGDAGSIETSRLQFTGDCDTHADDLLATRGEDERSDRDIAAEWLADELADGTWRPACEIKEAARAADITEKTLRRARERLGVEVRREGFPSVSEWRLPVTPTPTGTTGSPAVGHDRENRTAEPDTVVSDPAHAQDTELGATGANGHLDADAELVRVVEKFGAEAK